MVCVSLFEGAPLVGLLIKIGLSWFPEVHRGLGFAEEGCHVLVHQRYAPLKCLKSLKSGGGKVRPRPRLSVCVQSDPESPTGPTIRPIAPKAVPAPAVRLTVFADSPPCAAAKRPQDCSPDGASEGSDGVVAVVCEFIFFVLLIFLSLFLVTFAFSSPQTEGVIF